MLHMYHIFGIVSFRDATIWQFAGPVIHAISKACISTSKKLRAR